MKNLFKKLLACCLVVCMVLTLCVGAVTVSAEEIAYEGTLAIGEANVEAGATEATVSFTANAAGTGIAAAEVNVPLPAGCTSVSKVELETEDENVEVTFAIANAVEGLYVLDSEEFTSYGPDSADYEEFGAIVVTDNVFSYIIYANDAASTLNIKVNVTFAGAFNNDTEELKEIPVTATVEACKDAIDLINLQVTPGAINVASAHKCVAGEPVKEKEVPATCTTAGSYDLVTYCTCGKEMSRETLPITKLEHDYTYTDNKDGTHSATCPNGCAGITGEAHNYVDGTCVCGAVEVTECQHVHNDAPISATPAQEDGTKGEIVFHCELCNEDIPYEVTYRRASSSPTTPSIVLGSTTRMGVTLKISNAGDSNKGYFAYTHNYVNGAESTFHAFSFSEAEKDSTNYKWSIPAYYSQFSDEFVSAMYTYNDGEWTNGLTRVFSVKKTAMTFVTTDTVDVYTKRVAANLLKAGAATMSEFAKNVSTDLYPDVELVGDYAQYVTTSTPTIEQTEENWIVNQSNASADGMCGFANPGLILGESIKVKLTLNPKYYQNYKDNGDAALKNMKLVYSYTAYNGVPVESEISVYSIIDDGKMEFIFDTLPTTNLRCPIKFQLLDNGVPASYEVTYSVEAILSRAKSVYPNTIPALMNYADSVVDMQNNS